MKKRRVAASRPKANLCAPSKLFAAMLLASTACVAEAGTVSLLDVYGDNYDGLGVPFNAAASPDGGQLYVTDPLRGVVIDFDRKTTGELSVKALYNDTRLGEAWEIAISQDGRYAYVTDRSGSVNVFHRNANEGEDGFGTLELIQHIANGGQTENGATASGLGGTWGLALDKASNRVYVSGYDDNSLVVFTRSETNGKLSFLQALKSNTDRVTGLNGASEIALSPTGEYVYVRSEKSKAITVFVWDEMESKLKFVQALTAKNDSPNLDGKGDIDVTSDGLHLYVASDTKDTITIFDRDPETGTLTQSGSVPGFAAPYGITTSPDGTNLYVAYPANDSVAVFRRDPLTGALRLTETLSDTGQGVYGLSGVQNVVLANGGQQLYTPSTKDRIGAYTVQANDLAIVNTVEINGVAAQAVEDHPVTIQPNVPFDYVLTVTNYGLGTATHVGVSDVLPEGASLQTTPDGCTVADQIVACELGDMEPGAIATITLSVVGEQAGTKTNKAAVFADQTDPDGSNNRDSAELLVNSLPVLVDLEVTAINPSPLNIDVPLEGLDPDGDVIKIMANTGQVFVTEKGGSLVYEGGASFTYYPPDEFNGTDSFTYTVDDGKGGTVSGKVTVQLGTQPSDKAASKGTSDGNGGIGGFGVLSLLMLSLLRVCRRPPM